MKTLTIAVLVLFSTLAHGQLVPKEAQQGRDGYVLLDDDGRQLREDFNRGKGAVRLLFVVDPSCAACLRGMDDMNRDLFARITASGLQTFVVHVPVIGAEAKHVMPAAKLLPSKNVTHYWNEGGSVRWWLSDKLAIKNNKGLVPAWDVWLIFEKDATWTANQAPTPVLLMHQLEELESTQLPELNSESFAKRVRDLLPTQVKPSGTK
jgi:hypothetical protein